MADLVHQSTSEGKQKNPPIKDIIYTNDDQEVCKGVVEYLFFQEILFINCAIRNAVPEPIAILIEIKFE